MKLEDLNTERKEKLASCQSTEEMLKLAELEGIELDDEQLEAISGGDSWDSGHLGRPCPYCGKHVDYESGTRMPKYCPHCGGKIVFSRDD